MMYQNKFVACVKAGGKILREVDRKGDGAAVHLPFGTEYSLLLKNLSNQRAVAKVSIDGTDVLRGRTVVVEAGKEMELERFLDEMDRGNRFRFIEKTEAISDHRGDRVDDGIVRVEWQYEALLHWIYNSSPFYPSGLIGSKNIGSAIGSSNCFYSNNSNSSGANLGPATITACTSQPKSDAGITVKGSVSAQRFHEVPVGCLEAAVHVIAIILRGCSGAPLTVKDRIACGTCGAKSKPDARFCRACGTALAAAIGY